MDDIQTLTILLSIIVGLLSVVIIALLILIIGVMMKVRAIAQKIDNITTNVASASEWLSPIKVFGAIASMFRK